MNKQISLVEINVFKGMIPLVSGYLQAYACADPELAASFKFVKYTVSRETPFTEILNDLVRQESHIYGFSCYLWNIGLVKSLVTAFQKIRPDAIIILGGPQVMHHAHEYLNPENENLLLCNGEGEITFSNFLRELLNEVPDFSNVRGLSFYKGGELITTEAEDRIKTLDDIPSPFLNGYFEDTYRMTVLETNRGCPFHCGFCFWGAATNDKVIKYGDERVRSDIKWLSQSSVPFIFIADANWGIHKRDIGFAEYFAECKKENGVPVYVYFSAAKNSPSRVAEITAIFTQSGMFNSQPISMQSLDERTLEYIDRTNIKISAYEDLQADLNQRGITSFIELIWPLPGETLDSFKRGIETLIERKAAHLITYTHTLLHNTPIYKKRDDYGLVTKSVHDGISEAELVVETKEVSSEEFKDGLWFFYAVLAFHNTSSLSSLRDYLHSNQLMSYSEFFTAFSEYCKRNRQNPFSIFCYTSIAELQFYEVHNYPQLYHTLFHAERDGFDKVLFEFASSQNWWQDDIARMLFEIGMLQKPYLYSNTPVGSPQHPLEFIRVLNNNDRCYNVEIPSQYLSALSDFIENNSFNSTNSNPSFFKLDHRKTQHPFRPNQSRQDNADYCNGIIIRVHEITPKLETAG